MPLTATSTPRSTAARGRARPDPARHRTGAGGAPPPRHPVLDHGFVRVVDYMGDDSAIVQAARVSYGRGTKAVTSDEGLIRYLMRHWHSTPFEMCEIKLHVKLPVFVARQWIRHRTANVNEISARYSILDREFYIPAPETRSPPSPPTTTRAAATPSRATRPPASSTSCATTAPAPTTITRRCSRRPDPTAPSRASPASSPA